LETKNAQTVDNQERMQIQRSYEVT